MVWRAHLCGQLTDHFIDSFSSFEASTTTSFYDCSSHLSPPERGELLVVFAVSARVHVPVCVQVFVGRPPAVWLSVFVWRSEVVTENLYI